jgi:hypothetical protein
VLPSPLVSLLVHYILENIRNIMSMMGTYNIENNPVVNICHGGKHVKNRRFTNTIGPDV